VALFIDDGYTIPFEIPERPGVHERITGSVRPMTAKQRLRFWNGFDRLSADQQFERYVKAICDHVVEWSVGKPLKPETFETICHPVFDRLTAEALGHYPETGEKN
jgi:hypothetical protein